MYIFASGTGHQEPSVAVAAWLPASIIAQAWLPSLSSNQESALLGRPHTVWVSWKNDALKHTVLVTFEIAVAQNTQSCTPCQGSTPNNSIPNSTGVAAGQDSRCRMLPALTSANMTLVDRCTPHDIDCAKLGRLNARHFSGQRAQMQ